MVEPRGGRQAVLLCTVDSFPPSGIALRRGPGLAPLVSTWGPAEPRFTVRVAPNSLRVEMGGLELRDTGLYICSANNSYGTASSSLHLDVGGEWGPRAVASTISGSRCVLLWDRGSQEPFRGALRWCCPVKTQVLGSPRLPSLPPLPQASQSRLSPRQKSPKAPQPP